MIGKLSDNLNLKNWCYITLLFLFEAIQNENLK